MITLHPDQQEVLPKLRSAFKEHQSVILRAPCRFGKSVVAAYLARAMIDAGQSVLFGVHRQQLAHQQSNTFSRFGIHHSVIMSGSNDPIHPMANVAVADSIATRRQLLNGAWFMPDEGHLWVNGERAEMIDEFRRNGGRVLILTATPATGSGKPMSRIASHIVHGPKEKDLIAAGRLAQYLPIAPVRPDLTNIPISGSEFNKAAIDAIMSERYVVKEAVRYWKKFADGKRTISFATSRKRGAEYAAEFNDAGIPSVFMDGETPQDQRMNMIEAFADGHIKNLWNVGLFAEGFDMSAQVGRDVPIQAVGMYSPTRSLPKAIQMMMRPMTSQDGTAIILDHAGIMVKHDGTLNHGFPCDEREWSLEGSVAFKKSERVIPTCTCGECFGVFRYRSSCPYCHATRDIEGRSLPEIALEMEAIDPELIRQREEAERKSQRRKQGMAQTLESMADIAASKGYAVGWLMKVCPTKGIRVDWRSANLALSEAKRRMT